jgi:hypothetical protein
LRRNQLQKPYFGQALVSQNAADILVLDDEPWVASVPELDLGHGVGGTEPGVLGRRLSGGRTSEGELRGS